MKSLTEKFANWNRIRNESIRRYAEKIEPVEIRKVGKIRMKQVDWQNEIKAPMIGNKCENVKCNNMLEIGKMVCEHLLPQGTIKFKKYRMTKENVRIVCGCVNLDNYGKNCKLFGLRYCKIIEHFPDAEKWIREKIK